jgi:hypothetical protein
MNSTREQHDPIKHAATQKAPRYAYQHEYRLVLISYAMPEVVREPPDPLYVRLPRPPDYARLL